MAFEELIAPLVPFFRFAALPEKYKYKNHKKIFWSQNYMVRLKINK